MSLVFTHTNSRFIDHLIDEMEPISAFLDDVRKQL